MKVPRSAARFILVVAGFALAGCDTMLAGVRVPESTPPRRVFAQTGVVNAPLVAGQEPTDLPLTPAGKKSPLVMLAISGGGSRASYYAARVMEQLAQVPNAAGEGSVLDSVRVISGVSAGSLAAAWYCVNFDQRGAPDFFERFKNSMALNLQWRSYGHMAVFPPLALQLLATGVTRTDLLANEIERVLGRPATFSDLRAGEARPHDPAPILITNGTVYNTGQRLVMSNLPARRFPAPLADSRLRVASQGSGMRALMELMQPLTFEDFGSDIGSFRVAHAVAASAAYPILLAPFRLKVYPEHVPPTSAGRVSPQLLASPWIHVADGGLVENEGLDALISILKTLDRNQPVLVIVIQANFRLETKKVDRNEIWGPLDVIYRMYDIGTLRPLALYGAHIAQFHNPAALEAVVIRLEGYDPDTHNLLRRIPTAFKLSKEHREAIDAVAVQNVAHVTPELHAAISRLARSKR
jgi:predicted acylesterase/phospholipase RssA